MDYRRPAEANILVDLDARQDDVLARLDELDRQVERVLREFQAGSQPTDPAASEHACLTDV